MPGPALPASLPPAEKETHNSHPGPDKSQDAAWRIQCLNESKTAAYLPPFLGEGIFYYGV